MIIVTITIIMLKWKSYIVTLLKTQFIASQSQLKIDIIHQINCCLLLSPWSSNIIIIIIVIVIILDFWLRSKDVHKDDYSRNDIHPILLHKRLLLLWTIIRIIIILIVIVIIFIFNIIIIIIIVIVIIIHIIAVAVLRIQRRVF